MSSPPRGYMKRLQTMQQNFFLCTSSIAQWAGVAALTQAGPDVERMKAIYDQRRDVHDRQTARAWLRHSGRTHGAFYVFANAKKFTNDSMQFTFDLLERAGVGVAPGVDFGPGGEGYIRFSYANSIENIEEGMRRLEKYLGGLK